MSQSPQRHTFPPSGGGEVVRLNAARDQLPYVARGSVVRLLVDDDLEVTVTIGATDFAVEVDDIDTDLVPGIWRGRVVDADDVSLWLTSPTADVRAH